MTAEESNTLDGSSTNTLSGYIYPLKAAKNRLHPSIYKHKSRPSGDKPTLIELQDEVSAKERGLRKRFQDAIVELRKKYMDTVNCTVLLSAAILIMSFAPAAAEALDGKGAYVANFNEFTLSQYAVDPATGALAVLDPPTIATPGYPYSITVSPDGRSVYAVMKNGESVVAQYDIEPATGRLVPKDPPSTPTGGAPKGIAVSPDGRSAYVTNNIDRNISQFDVDPGTGTLSPKSPATVAAGTNPKGIAVGTDGHSVYVVNRSDDTVSQFDVDVATGTLSPKSPATVSTGGSRPRDIAVSPDGHSVYIPNSAESTIAQFDVDSATGKLSTKEAAATVETGGNPLSIAVSPDGRSAYVANSLDDTVSQYDVEPETGQLLEKNPATATVGSQPRDVVMSPDGKSAYVTNSGDETISQFDVNVANGQIAQKSPPVLATGLRPFSVAVSPNRGPSAAFTVNSDGTNNSVSFNASGSSDPDGRIAKHEWNFGDGSVLSGNEARPQHNYARPGSYTVTLTVTDDLGCSTEVITTGRTAYCNGGATAMTMKVVGISSGQNQDVIHPSPIASWPQEHAPGSTSGSSSAYKTACNIRITSPRLKGGKLQPKTTIAAKSRSRRGSGRLRVSASTMKKILRSGLKGYVSWGRVDGQAVVCKSIKLAILQKRGRHYYIPGNKTKVSTKYLNAKSFPTKGARFLKKRKVGKLTQKRLSSTKRTKFAFKEFNRRSGLGRKALKRLKKKGYRGTYLLIYTARVGEKTVKKTLLLDANKR